MSTTLIFRPVLGFFFLLASFCASSLDLSKVDYSYLYKDTNVNFKYQVAEREGTYRLHINMELRKVGANDDIKNFEITSQKKFTTKKGSPVEMLTNYKSGNGNIVTYDITLKPSVADDQYLVVFFKFLTQPYVIDIPIGDAVGYSYPAFIIKNPASPVGIIKQEDSLVFESIGRGNEYIGQLFEDKFKTATPPFSEQKLEEQRFEASRKDKASYHYKVLDKNYSFYFQSENSDKAGASFYSQRSYFPKSKEHSELIGPLKYISTQQEFEKLEKARNKQLAFDNFWLAMIPSNKLAARTLRNYYARVNRATELFSDYKAGWKTDRGMIFTIYGIPDDVHKQEGSEIWTYDTYNGRLTFSFAKVPNEITGFTYVLERNKKYSNVWYGQLDKWRKGDT
ncbi:GWxTD domain-containing protein [Reichenbachiella versicolor]|uniref:GWxTD domain-containing protein n=1 Tax=Reichenbachiella versicolor TaxID=1821036 RepID=UPI000D6DE730|nr:GWxTD domain-containing protein [Reichenbachiella versicolor]